jgi:Putative transcriptional regulator, homolog of Bvg accessory factor
MLLTVDVGNTTTAAAMFRNRSIAWRRRVPTPASWSLRALAGLLPSPWAGRVTAAIVSSVVPRLNRGLEAGIRRRCRVRPVFIDHRTPQRPGP